MGNIYSQIIGYEPQSPQTTENKNQPQELETRLQQLEQLLDRDRNNIVTKDELHNYFSQLTDKIDKNSDGIITRSELEWYVNTQIKTGQEEVEKWKSSYETLHNNYEQLLDKLRSKEKVIAESNISSEALKEYIQTEIIDTDANLGLVPDILEKKIYLTVYKTIMKSLEGLFNTSSVDLLNHRISFSIYPIPAEERNRNENN
jgi:hypothetical protein